MYKYWYSAVYIIWLFLAKDGQYLWFLQIAAEILLNLPKPYFAFKKYRFAEDDSNSYCLFRKWPKNGVLSGNGVSDTCFTPSAAGKGIHTITYSYTDESNQTYTRERELTVGNVGIEEYHLHDVQVYPNPSSGFTSIRFELAESLPVQISLFNIIGHEQMELLNEICMPGMQEVQLNTSQLRSGIYFVRITTDRITTCKLIVQ